MSDAQVQKNYANDWAKSRARALLRDMIDRNLLSKRAPHHLRVLCFPGVDAAEIYEVYDPLGIRRDKIVGIERDKEVADEIEKKKLGIQLVRGTLEDYVNSQPRLNFDVVSLDYIGALSERNMDSLRLIYQKQIAESFIVHHANLLRRDQDSEDYYFAGFSVAGIDVTRILDSLSADPSSEEFGLVTAVAERHRTMNTIFDNGTPRQNEKGLAYTQIISNAYRRPSNNDDPKVIKFVFGDLASFFISQLNHQMNDVPSHVKSAITEEALFRTFCVRAGKQGLTDPNFQTSAFLALVDGTKEGRYYRRRDGCSYAYISESGAPMVGDIYSLMYPNRSHRLSQRVTSLMGFPHSFHIDDVNELMDAVAEFINFSNSQISPEKRREVVATLENRQFLGNSSRAVLTKHRAIQEFRNGASVEDLKTKYRGWANKPLAQWKAHVTMGTYDSVRGADEEISSDPDDSDLERITREEAIDLLRSNIPVEEIRRAYPTSFSVGQLRAYKTHLSMGTYEEILK